MTCLMIQPLLSAYLDHELSDAERAMVEEHLATCAECQSEVRALEITQRYAGTTLRAMATASVSPSGAWQRLQARLSPQVTPKTVAQTYADTDRGITLPISPHPEEDPAMNVVTTGRSPAVEPQPSQPSTPTSDRMQTGLAIIAVAGILGALGNLLLRATPWGINVVLWVGAVVLGTVGLLRWRQIAAVGAGRWMVVPILLFAGCMAWRDSGALFLLNAVGLGTALALAAFRTVRGGLWRAGVVEYAAVVGRGALALLQAPLQVLVRDVRWRHLPRGAWIGVLQAVARGVVIAIPILVVFGGLLMGADAIFADYLSGFFDIDIPDLLSNLFLIAVFTWLSIAFLYQTVEGDSDPLARLERPRFAKLGVIEMGVVLGLLDLLFLVFVTIQFRYFFGGAEYLIQQAVGLTYAEYARRGFFELVTVAALLLPLLLGTHWLMAGTDQSKGSRWLWSGLASVAVVMIFVMITSGLMRMATYVQVFGLTELRVYASAFMGWVAVLFGWFALTVLRGHRRHFAFGALLTGFATILVLNVLSPDALIARTNLARHVGASPEGLLGNSGGPASLWDEEGRVPRAVFDPFYLTVLSGDAVPEIVAALPTLDRSDQCYIASQLLQQWTPPTEVDWRTWNWGRVQAWQAVRTSPAAEMTGCSLSSGEGRSDERNFFPMNGFAFLSTLLGYGIVLLTVGRIVQSLYARRMQPSLRYLLALVGVVGMFFVGERLVGYRPSPSYQSQVATSTAVPAHVTALIGRWSGTDTTTGQPIALHFESNNLTLSTPDGEFKGTYHWITSETIIIRLGHYTVPVGETGSLPCPDLPTVFVDVGCQQQVVSGYPAPMAATPVPQVPVGAYPAPLPTTVYTDALYQGIEAEYGVVVSRTDLTLIAPTGEVQSFTVAP